MLHQKYEKLVHYLTGMMQDGVQLIHGGNLFDWDDTAIPDLIKEIVEEQKRTMGEEIEPGTKLVNIHTGQGAFVINDTHNVVKMILPQNILEYPKEIIWDHFENPDKKKNGKSVRKRKSNGA